MFKQCWCGGWAMKPPDGDEMSTEDFKLWTHWHTSEKALQKRVESFLEDHGWVWQHNNDSRYANAGFPDLVAVRTRSDQHLVFIELKSMTGDETKPKKPEDRKRGQFSQVEWLDALDVIVTDQNHTIAELNDLSGGCYRSYPPRLIVCRLVRPCCQDKLFEALA